MRTITVEHNDSMFGFPAESELEIVEHATGESGIMTRRAADAFCNGHCHSFAYALRDVVEGDIELAGLYEPQYGGGEDMIHVLVKVDDDVYVDARGTHTEEALLENYEEGSYVSTVDVAIQVACYVERREYRPIMVDEARPFALTVAVREGLDTACTAYEDDGHLVHDGGSCPIHEAACIDCGATEDPCECLAVAA